MYMLKLARKTLISSPFLSVIQKVFRSFYAFSLVILSNHHPSILCCPDCHTLSQFSLTSSPSCYLFLTWSPGFLPIGSTLNLHTIIWIISWIFSFQWSPLFRFFHSICNFFLLLVPISHTHFNNTIPVMFLFLFSFQCPLSKVPSLYFNLGPPILHCQFSVLVFFILPQPFLPNIMSPIFLLSQTHRIPIPTLPTCFRHAAHFSSSSCPIFCP